jgi:hypothetical protein
MNFSKLLSKEITISLFDGGFVSKTRYARFFRTSDVHEIDVTGLRSEEAAPSESLLNAPRNSDQRSEDSGFAG